jgi:hypothetical protein
MSYGEAAISLPEGYRALPLCPENRDALLSIHLLTRSVAVNGTPFILLRETADGSIYPGCLVDSAGDPKDWLEIWVQNADRMAQSFRAQIEAMNNSLLDRRWSERLAVFEKLLAELELLQLRSRSLVVTDWDRNVEVRDAIETVIAKHGIEN